MWVLHFGRATRIFCTELCPSFLCSMNFFLEVVGSRGRKLLEEVGTYIYIYIYLRGYTASLQKSWHNSSKARKMPSWDVGWNVFYSQKFSWFYPVPPGITEGKQIRLRMLSLKSFRLYHSLITVPFSHTIIQASCHSITLSVGRPALCST